MTPVPEARVPIIRRDGGLGGHLRVRLRSPVTGFVPPLLDCSSDPERDPALEDIQLLEDWEYLYEIEPLDEAQHWTSDNADILSSDELGSRRGRLRPGSNTGSVAIEISGDGLVLGSATFEVRSRKLNYRTHYRWMLRDITEEASGILLQQFASAAQRFIPHDALPANTAYERFSFLRATLTSPRLVAAFGMIVAAPHRDWLAEVEMRSPAQGMKPNTASIRRLVSAPHRDLWPDSFIPGVKSLPTQLEIQTREHTVDTPPNRFVKYAIRSWMELVADLRSAISQRGEGDLKRRGLRETDSVLELLETMASEPLFREVGQMSGFPEGNTVLPRREGYKEFLEAYIQSEAALRLSWGDPENVFRAGVRDVAQLYEAWCFVQLAASVKSLCDSFDETSLVKVIDGTSNISLNQGRETLVQGIAERLGRKIEVMLYYNRSFSGSGANGSWTRAMRPDCSVMLRALGTTDSGFETAWIHFDAKYKADRLADVLGEPGESDSHAGEVQGPSQSFAKRDDLLKMHAYRDAIRRSLGSYVLYPGIVADERGQVFQRYQEIMPGLGALALRPAEDGVAAGSAALTAFLADILDHFASVLTQERRGRYWEAKAFNADSYNAERIGWDPVMNRPPADTPVLLGYVRNPRHLEWIRKASRYNLRLGSRSGAVGLAGSELGAHILVLYGPTITREVWWVGDEPELWTREDLIADGYPGPRGELYLCLRLLGEVVIPLGQSLDPARINEVVRRRGSGLPVGVPILVSWWDVVG